MQVEIVQGGRILRSVNHQSQVYVEAPSEGTYSIRLRNDTHRRRLVVLSVDGVNVVNGEDAGFQGPGYVLMPWQTADIPGWRRTDGTVAAFRFQESEESYAAQTGRGTNNVGIIGVAVFDEKVKPQVARPPIVVKTEHHHHHHHHNGWWGVNPTLGSGVTFSTQNATFENMSETTTTSNTLDCREMGPAGAAEAPVASASTFSAVNPETARAKGLADSAVRRKAVVRSVGTGYGEEQAFHTTTTDFERASTSPAEVVCLRYGTRDQLTAWGVPVDAPVAVQPNAFPMSQPSVPAPPGWRG